MNDAARLQREVGAPVEAVEHVDHRQPVDRRLRVRPELDRARPAPAFVHRHFGEPAGGELADRRAPVDMIDRLEIDVLGEIEMAVEAVEAVAALLVGHRAGDDVDAVPRSPCRRRGRRDARASARPASSAGHGSRGHGRRRRRRRGTGRPSRSRSTLARRQAAADRDVRFAVGSEPVGIVHPVDVGEHDVAGRLERRRQQARHRRLARPPHQRQHLDIAEGEGKRRNCRRIPRRREARLKDVLDGQSARGRLPRKILAHTGTFGGAMP